MPYKQPGHGTANSVTVPWPGQGFGEGWCTDAGFASSLGQKETLSHRLPPGPQAPGGFCSYQSGARCWWELRGCWERQEKATSKPCKSTRLCVGNGEGDRVLCWHSPQAASGTDWFLFNYYYSSLGGCCTIYSGLSKTHAPSFEGKMAILSF